MAVVHALVGDTLLLHQTGLATNLSSDFVVGKTGGGEDGNLLASSNRVHGIDGGDTGRNHLLGIFLYSRQGGISLAFVTFYLAKEGIGV